MSARRASHAGTWYDSNPTKLARAMREWLNDSPKVCEGRVKALICPHAGFRYSGATAARAWKQIEPSEFKRVFLLGPSHHKYFRGVNLPAEGCVEYFTPLGSLPLDNEILQTLRNEGAFGSFSLAEDEAEHSLELMLPFLRLLFSPGVKIVPLFVGDLRDERDLQAYADFLVNYFLQPDSLFIISSDFCHWGLRYAYYYLETENPNEPIYKTIERMDMKAVALIEGHKSREFFKYIETTGLSVCGHNPINLLLQLIGNATARGHKDYKTKLVCYSQSNAAKSRADSSVSYASICTFSSSSC